MLEEEQRLLQSDYQIVGSVEDGRALVEAAERLKPDVIISDISMPVMTGFEAIAKIRRSGSQAKIIFLTVQSSAPYLKKARALGAEGYVLKVYAAEQLSLAVSRVLTGSSFVSPQLQAGEWRQS